jgi:hypothetical protein
MHSFRKSAAQLERECGFKTARIESYQFVDLHPTGIPDPSFRMATRILVEQEMLWQWTTQTFSLKVAPHNCASHAWDHPML